MRKLALLSLVGAILLTPAAFAQGKSSYYWDHGYSPFERSSRATAPSTNTILYFDGTQFVNASVSTVLTSIELLSYTATPAVNSATTNNALDINLTSPIDTTGTNTHQGFNFDLTVSNASGGTNTVNGFNFANYTGDAQVNVNAIKIGTSDGLGTAYGLNIGTGWDRGISTASPIVNTYAASADSAATNNSTQIAPTIPVDTTGTNTHTLLSLSPTISNSTGGTNTVNGVKVENVTGDAQVDVKGISIGTGTRLGASDALTISTGWDKGIDITNTAAADSGATEMGIDINLTTPVDTTGTNVHYGLNIDTTIGNASGGTNTATAINIANTTGDAQVTETGIAIGTGFDTGLSVASPVTVNSTIAANGDVSGDGGDQFVGFKQNQVVGSTTPLTIAQCGSTVVSTGAAVQPLPEASTALGCQYTFVCGTADDFDIDPADGTDQIGSVSTTNGTTGVVTLAPAAGDEIRCTDIGGSITLEAIAADLWAQVGGGNGVWTDVN